MSSVPEGLAAFTEEVEDAIERRALDASREPVVADAALRGELVGQDRGERATALTPSARSGEPRGHRSGRGRVTACPCGEARRDRSSRNSPDSKDHAVDEDVLAHASYLTRR
jgi:hypothetical protein